MATRTRLLGTSLLILAVSASAHLTDEIILQKELAWVQGAIKHVQFGFDETNPLKHYEYLDFEDMTDMVTDDTARNASRQGLLRGSFSA